MQSGKKKESMLYSHLPGLSDKMHFHPYSWEKKMVCLWRINLNFSHLHCVEKGKGCSPVKPGKSVYTRVTQKD